MSLIDQIEVNQLSSEDFVKLTYLTLLRRKIDEVGLHSWKKEIEKGTFNYKQCLDTILNSPEYLMLYRTPFHEMVHRGRQIWVRTLERFDSIFDIGGSSPNIEMGALIELGYPHWPREIFIFDLPEEKQYWGKPKFSQKKDFIFSWGKVRHLHGYIENIYDFKQLMDLRFTCVFMGQTIEHIRNDKLPVVLKWIREHLKKEGRFIFDTPNRDITKIQFPEGYIDKDHAYEYTPRELEEILVNHQFEIIRKTGILNMPGTYASKQFNPLEVYETELLNAEPETSYLFAFECRLRKGAG